MIQEDDRVQVRFTKATGGVVTFTAKALTEKLCVQCDRRVLMVKTLKGELSVDPDPTVDGVHESHRSTCSRRY